MTLEQAMASALTIVSSLPSQTCNHCASEPAHSTAHGSNIWRDQRSHASGGIEFKGGDDEGAGVIDGTQRVSGPGRGQSIHPEGPNLWQGACG
jgi:hypothetical protein